MSDSTTLQERMEQLELEIRRLEKVNKVLMNRVERSMESGGDSYSLFESNILLQKTIDERTDTLRAEVQERMRAEAQLRESNQRLLLHLQQTPLGVIEWDLDFRVVEWNRAAEEIFGFTRKEAVGHRAVDLIIPEESKSQLVEVFHKLLTRQGGARRSNENIHKDGRRLSCDWYNTPLVNAEGEVVGVASLVQDVTDRVSSDREKRERLNRAQKQRVAIGRMTTEEIITSGDFERATKMILEIVSEAVDVGRVSLWLFNDDHSELMCFDLYDLSTNQHTSGTTVKKSDFPIYFEAISRDRVVSCADARLDPRSSEFSDNYLSENGIASMLDVVFRVSGNLVGVVCLEHSGECRTWSTDEIAFADEISSLISQVYLNAQRRRSEEQKNELEKRLERAERMESLGILAGGVAHDLNNVLGPMVGYSELILQQLDDKEKTAERVKRIGKSAQEAADVIQDLLTLARRGRCTMMPTDLNQVVRNFLESPAFSNLTYQRPEVEVVVDLDESIGKMHGSPPHLSKAIMNLIFNAFDAIHGGGKVSIITGCQHLEELSNGLKLAESSGNYLFLRIVDTGEGIAPEYIEKIFEPYFSRKKLGRSSGSGLGLSVVYGVVKDHQGYYDVTSTPGKGTEFSIFFPVVNVREKRIRDDRHEIRGTESILIVDDNAGQREIAQELIGCLGYCVVTAASGEEAVEYLKDHSVDLVLLDMIMDPGIDGLDTYREIIKLHPGQKAIIASGFSATDRVEEMQRLGAGQYIRKPYSLSAVGRVIREELDKVKSTVGA